MAKLLDQYVAVLLVLALVVVHTCGSSVPTESAGSNTSAKNAPADDAGLKDEKHFLTFGGLGGVGGFGGVAGIVGLPALGGGTGGVPSTGGIGGVPSTGGTGGTGCSAGGTGGAGGAGTLDAARGGKAQVATRSGGDPMP
ncbi:hypothetical protein AAC387_Pa01g3950 [Persea americana]